jgi:hypothetical protein
VVICLRNPLEVANSLLKRNYFSSASSFNLWLRYNQAILAYTESENRIITHYNSYFDDSSLEFSRLSNFLGLDLTKERIMEVCDTVKPTLHHNQFSFLDLIDKAPSEVTNLYKKMSDEASESPPLPITFPNPTMDFDNSLLRANSTEEQIKLLSKELANTKRDLHDKEKELSEIHKSKAWKFIQFIRALKQRTNL